MTTNEPTRAEMTDNEEIKTKFKGPGEWRSQAKKLESEGQESPDKKKD